MTKLNSVICLPEPANVAEMLSFVTAYSAIILPAYVSEDKGVDVKIDFCGNGAIDS